MELARADVNQSSFGYPLAEIDMDNRTGTWANVEIGHYYQIVDGSGNVVTTGVVRKLPTTTVFYFSALYHGDPGIAQRIGREIGDNFTIIVYDFYPIWSMLSQIRNGVFYKRWDVAYASDTVQPNPVCNIGGWRWALVDTDTDEAQFIFSAADSFSWFGGGLTFLWTLPAGVTLVSGTLTSATITVSVPVGFHKLICVVTDTNGKTARGMRPIWVKTRDQTEKAFSGTRAIVSASDKQSVSGRQISFTIDGALTNTLLHRGAAVVMGESPTFNGVALDPGIYTDTYVGFVTGTNKTGHWKRKTSAIDTVSPFLFASNAPMVPQALIETASTARWIDVPTGFGNPSFAAWYVLAYHCPNFLLLFDFHKLTDSSPPRKHQIAINADSVAGQLTEVSAFVGGTIGSASDGSLFFSRDPNLEDNSFRNALDARCDIIAQDVLDQIEYPESYPTPTGQLTVYGWVITDADEVTAWGAISGRAQGQGPARTGGNTFIVSSTDELRDKVGHAIQKMNHPTPEYRIKINRNMDIFDPARHARAWFNLNIPAKYDPYGVGYSGRAQVKQVDRNWRILKDGLVLKDITVTFTPETFGQRGDLLPRDPKENWDSSYFEPEDFEILAANIAIVWNESGALGRTYNLLDEIANYESIKASISGVVSDVVFDRSSPYFLSGLVEGDCGAWAVAVDGTTVNIYYCTDVLGDAAGILWTLQKSYTAAHSSVEFITRLATDNDAAGVCWVAWHANGVVKVAKTTNGVDWDSSLTTVGTSVTNSSWNGKAFAFNITEGKVYVIARPTTDTGNWHTFSAVSTVGSFTEVTLMPTVNQPFPQIHFPGDSTAYLSSLASATELLTNTSHRNLVSYSALNHAGITYAGVQVSGATDRISGADADGSYRFSVDCVFEYLSFPDDVARVWAIQTELGMPPYTLNFSIQGSLYSGATWDFDVDWSFEILDSAMLVLYSTNGSQSFSITTPPLYPTGSGFTITSSMGFVQANARYFRLHAETTSDTTWEPSLHAPPPSQGYFLFLRIAAPILFGERSTSPLLARIAPFPPASIDDIVDVSPDASYKAIHRNSIATGGFVDPVSALTESGSVERLYDSVDAGENWTLINSGVTDFRGLRRGGDILIGWGDDVLAISDDRGETFFDVRGDWEQTLGALGNVTGILAIL